MPKSDNRFNKSRSTGKKPAFKSDRKSSDSKKSYGSKDSSDKPRFDKRERSSGGDKKFDKPYKKRDDDGGEKRSYRGSDDKKPFRKKFGDDKGFGEKRSFGDRKKSFGSDDKKPFRKRDDDGEKKPFRKKFGDDKGFGEKRSFGDRDKKKSFDSDDKKPFRKRDDDKGFGEKRSFGDRDKKKSFGSDDKKPFRKREDSGDEKRSYRGSDDKKPFYKKRDDGDGEKKSFNNDGEKRRKFKPRGAKKPNHNSDDFLPNPDGLTRLNKYLSNAGICSRREADDLIKAGTVSVNGKVITEMGFKVGPTDKITYAGETLRHQKKIYLMLNKPKDYITTTDDPQERKTVMELIAGACKERVYPVGRLDRNTTGLLLFTNDGELATKLMHPKFGIKKVYQVTLDKNLKAEDYEKLTEGFDLEDGFIKPDELSYINGNKKELGIEVHSGRNRIVRRIFEHLDYEVIKLDRVVFAGLTKKDLPRAKWRFLTDKEVGFLKMIG
ncbi:MAG: rRNA pseudouridine synthase [Bacteroidia bacterium]|nr:rRNA pseudouridine synthase [Bacteroidia bacterium]